VSIQVRPGQSIVQTASGLHEGGEGYVEEDDLAVITFSWLDMADAVVGTPVVATYDSAGTYVASLTAPTDFGRYRLQVATLINGETTYAYRDVTVGVAYKGGVTVAELRRRIASKLKDWIGIVATQDAGSNAQFTDEDNLYAEAYQDGGSRSCATRRRSRRSSPTPPASSASPSKSISRPPSTTTRPGSPFHTA
jgi:hypothetical protein